jgi:hypothetical protein
LPSEIGGTHFDACTHHLGTRLGDSIPVDAVHIMCGTHLAYAHLPDDAGSHHSDSNLSDAHAGRHLEAVMSGLVLQFLGNSGKDTSVASGT